MEKEFKEKLLEMLNYIKQQCEENQLNYYAIGGTMLGALRHNGFIPWDNDIDIAMPRSDYFRLASIVNSRKDKYIIELPDSKNKDYLYSVAKLYDTTTTVVEGIRSKTKRGVYIDIFPMDGIGNNENEINKNYRIINFYNNLFSTRTSVIRKGRAWYKNASIILSRIVPESLLSTKKLLIKLDNLCASFEYDKYEYVGVLLTQYGKKYIMPKSWFYTYEEYPFENTTIRGVSDYDKYLTHLFGDWRKLPPKEKQVEGHDFIYIDLNHSYLEGSE